MKSLIAAHVERRLRPLSPIALAAASGLLCCASSALRAAAPSETGSQDAVPVLSEIVVTAQRRSEDVQKVPIAIAVLTDQQLKDTGMTSSTQLAQVVPGLNLSTDLGGIQPTLRGIGSANAGPHNEASVSTYVDGVYYADMPASVLALANVDHVEVLYGPQGTLFGRNSTAGLINVVTKDPSHELSGNAMVGYGNYNTVATNGYITGGLGDNVASDFSVYYQRQADGWGRNLLLGSEAFRSTNIALRNKWLAEFGGTKLTLALDYTETRSDQNGTLFTTFPGQPIPPGGIPPIGYYNVVSNVPGRNIAHQGGGYLRLDQDVNFAKLVSISAYHKGLSSALAASTFAATPSTDSQLDQEFEYFTQEVQLLSPAASPINWIVGGFYMHRLASYSPLGIVINSSTLYDVFNTDTTNSVAGYGQATIPITAATHITLGARFTSDKLSYDGHRDSSSAALVIPSTSGSTTQSQPTWRAALDHSFTNDLMGYLSYNRGFKSGFYTLSSIPSALTNPERLDAYELGLKSQLGDKVRASASVFDYNYKDIQELVVVGAVSQTINAAKAKVQGADFQIQAAPVESVVLNTGIEYLWKRDFESFPDGIRYVLNPTGNGTDLRLVNQNLAGNYLPRSSALSITAGLQYTAPTTLGKIAFNANAKYTSRFAWDPDNRLQQPNYVLVNSQVSLIPRSYPLRITLWANNVFNKEYLSFAAGNSPGDQAVPGAPRTFGINLDYSF